MADVRRAERGEIADRRRQAMELRLAGVDAITIARRLSAWDEDHAAAGTTPLPFGYGWHNRRKGLPRPEDGVLVHQVHQDVRRTLAARRAGLDDAAEQYVQINRDRLERLLAGVWGPALAGDVQASQQALRIIREQLRLDGHFTVQGPNGADDTDVADVVADMLAAIDQAVGPAASELLAHADPVNGQAPSVT